MNRRQAFGGLAALAVAGTSLRQAHAAIEFVSEGFGLAIDDFTEIWGDGEPGQTYLQYPLSNGTWFIGQNRDGFVTYIERSWDDETDVSQNDAAELALSVMPEESNLMESYRASFGAIAHGIRIDRYESASLADQLGVSGSSGEDFLARTSFVVTYELVPMTSELDYAVRRVSIIHRSDLDDA
jgi:hypothetical protein